MKVQCAGCEVEKNESEIGVSVGEDYYCDDCLRIMGKEVEIFKDNIGGGVLK